MERVSPQGLGQFLNWGLARHWRASDGETDYRENISNMTVPIRITAGAIDKLCPPHNQRAGYEVLGTDHKDLVVAGREEGFDVDYSHLGFARGNKAPEEIPRKFSHSSRTRSNATPCRIRTTSVRPRTLILSATLPFPP